MPPNTSPFGDDILDNLHPEPSILDTCTPYTNTPGQFPPRQLLLDI